MINFMGEHITEGKKYVYLKNERTGSSTIRKLKMVGRCLGFKGSNVVMKRLACAESTYFDEENVIDKVCADDVICEWKPTSEQWKIEVE